MSFSSEGFRKTTNLLQNFVSETGSREHQLWSYWRSPKINNIFLYPNLIKDSSNRITHWKYPQFRDFRPPFTSAPSVSNSIKFVHLFLVFRSIYLCSNVITSRVFLYLQFYLF